MVAEYLRPVLLSLDFVVVGAVVMVSALAEGSCKDQVCSFYPLSLFVEVPMDVSALGTVDVVVALELEVVLGSYMTVGASAAGYFGRKDLLVAFHCSIVRLDFEYSSESPVLEHMDLVENLYELVWLVVLVVVVYMDSIENWC